MKKFLAAFLMLTMMCTGASAMVNPWTDTTAEGIQQNLGLSFNEPEGAENTVYRMLEQQSIAEMQFDWAGAECTARIQPTAEFVDISGMHYEWSAQEDCWISWCEGKILQTKSDDAEIALCLWFDAAPGLMYSLSASASSLENVDVLQLSELVYLPAQGEEDGDSLSADAMQVALESCTGYAGTAGSSLKEAIAASGLAEFAVEYCIADAEDADALAKEAHARLTEEQQQELALNLEGICSLNDAAFADWNAVKPLFEDAGAAESMENLLQNETAQTHWTALAAILQNLH